MRFFVFLYNFLYAPDAATSATLLPDNKQGNNSNSILTYRKVQNYEIRQNSPETGITSKFVARPIVIVGPFRLELSAHLVRSMPHAFQYPLPHTSRPRRPDEVNGVKYHFDTKERILENQRDFVEIGEHKSNYYRLMIFAYKNTVHF